MRALRRTSILISILFITVVTIAWAAIVLQSEHFSSALTGSVLYVVGLDLFFAVVLWAPYHFRDSKYANVVTCIAFALSLLPVIFIFVVINALNGMHC